MYIHTIIPFCTYVHEGSNKKWDDVMLIFQIWLTVRRYFEVILFFWQLKGHSQVWDNFWKQNFLQMMKKAFYFTLKACIVLKYLYFCLHFLAI